MLANDPTLIEIRRDSIPQIPQDKSKRRNNMVWGNTKFSQSYLKFLKYLEKTNISIKNLPHIDLFVFGRNSALKVYLEDKDLKNISQNSETYLDQFIENFEKNYENPELKSKKFSNIEEARMNLFLKDLYSNCFKYDEKTRAAYIENSKTEKKNIKHDLNDKRSGPMLEQEYLLNHESDKLKQTVLQKNPDEDKKLEPNLKKKAENDLLKGYKGNRNTYKIMKIAAKKFLGNKFSKFKYGIRKFYKSQVSHSVSEIKERTRKFLCEEDSDEILNLEMITGNPYISSDSTFILFPMRNKAMKLSLITGIIEEIKPSTDDLATIFAEGEYFIEKEKYKSLIELFHTNKNIKLEKSFFDLVIKKIKREGSDFTLLAFIFNKGEITFQLSSGQKENKLAKKKIIIPEENENELSIKSLVISPDGNSIAFILKDSDKLFKSDNLSIFENESDNVVNIKIQKCFELKEKHLNCMTISEKGDIYAVGTLSEGVFIMDYEKFDLQKLNITLNSEIPIPIVSLNFTAKDSLIIVTSDESIHICKSNDGSELHRIDPGFVNIKYSLQSNSTGKIIIVFSDYTIKVYEGKEFLVQAGDEIKKEKRKSVVQSIDYEEEKESNIISEQRLSNEKLNINYKFQEDFFLMGDSLSYISIHLGSGTNNEKALISNSYGVAILVDLKKGKPERSFNFQKPIVMTDFSKDGSKIAFSFEQQSIKVYDLFEKSELTQTIKKGDNNITDGFLSVFLDSTHIAVIGKCQVSIFNLQKPNPKQICNLKLSGGKNVRTVAASNGIFYIAFGFIGGVIKILPIKTEGEEISFGNEVVLYGHCLTVNFMTFSKNNEKFASGGQDETIRLIDTKNSEEILVIKAKKTVASLDFSPDGSKLVVCLNSLKKNRNIYEIHLYDTIDGHNLFNIMSREYGFTRAIFSADGNNLITNYVSACQLISLKTESKPEIIYSGQTYSVAISPNGRHLVYSKGSKIIYYEPEGGKHFNEGPGRNEVNSELSEDEDMDHSHKIINILKFSNTGNSDYIAAGYDDGTVDLFNLQGLSLVTNSSIKKKSAFSILSMSFSSDDRYLAVGSTEGIISLLKLPENLNSNSTFVWTDKKINNCSYNIRTIAFDPLNRDNDKIIISLHNALKILTIEDFTNNSIESDIETEPDFIGVDKEINCLDWSSDGNEILTGSDDGVCTLFNLGTRALVQRFANHQGSVWSVIFIDNSNKFISGGEDRTLKLVDKITGVELYRYEMERGRFIWSVAFSAVNDLLVTGNDIGITIFKRFFNSTSALNRKTCVLDDAYTPINIQKDFSVFPYPIQINRLQLSILTNGDKDTRYIDDLIDFYSSKSQDDPILNSIGSFLYMPDSCGRNAWDYSFDYVDKNRYLMYSKLIALHLLLPQTTRRFHHLIHNKRKILKLVKSFYLSKLAPMFDSFVGEPITISLPSIKTPQLRFIGPPFPSSYWIRSKTTLFNVESKNSDSEPNLISASKHTTISKVLPFPFNNREQKEKSINPHQDRIVSDIKNSEEYSPILMNTQLNKPISNFFEENVNYTLRVFQINEPEALDILDKYRNLPITDQIFQSENFKNLIEYFWEEKFELYFLLRLFIYCCFLTIVCFDFLWVYPERSKQVRDTCDSSFDRWMISGIILDILIILFLIIYFLIGELKQMIINKKGSRLKALKKYLSNMWNVLDIIMVTNGISSASWDIAGIYDRDLYKEEDYSKYIKISYAFFYLSSWMRLLEFARGIKFTSTLIRLLSKVTQDMIAFLLVLFFMLLGFAFMAYILQTNYIDHDHWEFVKSFYYILLGDYGDYKGISPDTSLSKDLYFFILVAVTIIMVILMLNMLIALISESHGDVMKLEKQAAVYEKLQLIIDMKNSMFDTFLRKFNNKKIEDLQENFLSILSNEKAQTQKEIDLGEQVMELSKELTEIKRMIKSLPEGSDNK